MGKATAKPSMIGEYDKNNALRQETVWLGDLPVAAVKKDAAGLFLFYPIQADHLNTPRVILNNTNTPVWRWDATDAFGTVLPNGDPDGDGSLFEYNLRFPGQFYDQETGLHYNTFRDYDPVTGRYIDSDPIGLRAGWNTYGYVSGNPVNWVDPLGLFVIGSYNSATGQLTLTDQDTGNSVTTQAESGVSRLVIRYRQAPMTFLSGKDDQISIDLINKILSHSMM